MNDIAVSVQNLSKTFKCYEALKNINHDFESGKIHGIVGNNGSGKTVLFKCICGFLIPTSGKVFVDYEEIGKDVDFPNNTGIIIETPGFLPQYTGLKNLQILAGLKRVANYDSIIQSMRAVGLDPSLKSKISEYSLGMRQRLGIAQAIMENPDILILDEPMNGLDKKGVILVRELLNSLCKEGKTIILASHNPYDISELCQTVCEMDYGTLKVIRN